MNVSVFLNIQEALDKIGHKILKEPLQSRGLPPSNSLGSLLLGRYLSTRMCLVMKPKSHFRYTWKLVFRKDPFWAHFYIEHNIKHITDVATESTFLMSTCVIFF